MEPLSRTKEFRTLAAAISVDITPEFAVEIIEAFRAAVHREAAEEIREHVSGMSPFMYEASGSDMEDAADLIDPDKS